MCWSAISRRDLEAAKIRNEHHKVHRLYDNEYARTGDQVVATMGHTPHSSQVATLATNRLRSTTPLLWLCAHEK